VGSLASAGSCAVADAALTFSPLFIGLELSSPVNELSAEVNADPAREAR
jgi:hypothetical protein